MDDPKIKTDLRKFKNIQALRGVAVLMIVFLHLAIIEQKYGGARTILPKLLEFGIFGVDLFFVISGFVIATVTRGQFQDPKKALGFLYRRVSRIYPTYWVYCALVLGVLLYHPPWVNSSQGHQVDILSSFLLLPSGTLPLVIVAWTLEHEIYFYLVMFLLMLTTPERYLPFALLVWGAGVFFFNAASESYGPLARLASHPLTVEFIGGCFLAIFYGRKSDGGLTNRSLSILGSAGVMAAILGYASCGHVSGQADPQGWWRILLFGLPALLIVFCLIGAERNGCVAPSSLIRIGDASYSIYLSHVLTLSAAGRVWAMFARDTVCDNAVMAPILLTLAVVVGLLSHRLIEKPLLACSRRIA